MAVRLAAAVLLAANRLDVVRVLGVFVGYEFFWDQGYRYLLSHYWPVWDGTFWNAAIGIMHFGVLGALLLFAIGRLRFFRWKQDRGLPWWQACLYMPAAVFSMMLTADLMHY